MYLVLLTDLRSKNSCLSEIFLSNISWSYKSKSNIKNIVVHKHRQMRKKNEISFNLIQELQHFYVSLTTQVKG